MKNKTKINKWDLIYAKSNCTAKEIISERRQPSEWKKFLQMKIPTGNLSPTCTNNLYSAISKNKQSNKKSAKDLNAHFFKEGIEMAIKHIKRCSASLLLREKQMKYTMKYHLTLIKWPCQKTYNSEFCRGCGEKGTLLHCWWECKLVHPLGRTLWRFLEN